MVEIWLQELVTMTCPLERQPANFTISGFVDPAGVQVQVTLEPGSIAGVVTQSGNQWTCQFTGVPQGSFTVTAQGSDGSSDGCDVVVGGAFVQLRPGGGRGPAGGHTHSSRDHPSPPRNA
jgi:hypothetical protein